MTADTRVDAGAYFFLSYAHIPARIQSDEALALDSPAARPDLLVTRFFNDLTNAVSRVGDADSDLTVGFYDQNVVPGAGLKQSVASAISRAQVLVPLYSPHYVSNSWTLSEYRAFDTRLHSAERDPAGHVQPVLWVPLSPAEAPPDGLDLLGLAPEMPEYAENGLCAMSRLSIYRDQYREIVDRLARRIVQVAEHAPIKASPPLPLSVAEPTDVASADFVVAVLTGRTDDAPPDADDTTVSVWRPFPQAAAQYAASVAERLGLSTTVCEVLARALPTDRPTLLLVDGQIAATPSGGERLGALIAEADRASGQLDWLTIMVVGGEADADALESRTTDRTTITDTLDATISPVTIIDVPDTASLMAQMQSTVNATRRGYLRMSPAIFAPMPSLRRRVPHGRKGQDT